MKKVVLLVSLFSLGNVFAFALGEDSLVVTEGCYDAIESESGQIACELGVSTTSAPTMTLADFDSVVESTDGSKALIDEVNQPAKDAKISKAIAMHFDVEVEDVQAVVKQLKENRYPITMEEISIGLDAIY